MYHKAFGGRALPEPVGFRGFPGGGRMGRKERKEMTRMERDLQFSNRSPPLSPS